MIKQILKIIITIIISLVMICYHTLATLTSVENINIQG